MKNGTWLLLCFLTFLILGYGTGFAILWAAKGI